MNTPLMQPPPPGEPRPRRDPDPFATWEIASWTLTVLIAMMLVAALIQHAREKAEWGQQFPPAKTTPAVVCMRGVCARSTP